MMSSQIGFVAALEQAATAAQQEELRFRANVASEIARRERERQFAFRRVELAKVMARAAAPAATLEEASAAQVAAFRREFGWHGENEQRKAALEAWRAVADAVWRDLKPDASSGQPRTTVPEAMAQFEAWYTTRFGSHYLTLLDQDIPELPVVEC